MKKVLSTLMILVMMICFNTSLHVSAKGSTVMKYGAIAVLNVVEIVCVGYLCLAYGYKEGYYQGYNRGYDHQRYGIFNQVNKINQQYKANQSCKDFEEELDRQARAHRQNVDEMQRTISILKDSVRHKSSELYDCKESLANK